MARRGHELGRGMVALSALLLVSSCGGDPYGGQQVSLVVGRVADRTDHHGIEGIETCLEIPYDGDTVRTCAATDATGRYDIVEDEYLIELSSDRTSTLAVRDVDGDDQGAYLAQDVPILPANLPMTIDVELEPATR